MSEHDDEARRGYPGGSSDPGQDGRPHDERNGHVDPAPESAFPADLAAVRADDALLDALGGRHSTISPSDEPLANVLLQWRREVDAEPVAELVDTDTAMALVAGTRRPTPRRNPMLMPFAAAAALLVIAFSGVGLAAKSAEPGDRLWGVTRVLYAEHARSVETATTIDRELREAEAALDHGREAAAEVTLDRIKRDLDVVAEEDGHDLLAERHEVLLNEMAGKPANQDEPSGPAAGSSSPESSAPAEQPPPAGSGPTEQPGQSTSPPDDATSTSEPQPDTETSTPMVEPPNSGAQPDSSTPSGRSEPEPGETASGTTLGTQDGLGVDGQPGPGSDDPAPGT